MDVGAGRETSNFAKDFVEERGGYLRLTDEELEQAKEDYPSIVPVARRLLEYGADKEGYWTGERFMEQMKNGYCRYQIRR